MHPCAPAVSRSATTQPVPLGHARQHLAPVIDDHRIAVSLAPARMHAPLRRRDQAAQVFDGACPQQRFPVRLAGRHRERRRHHEQLRALARQHPEQLRKTHVVAHGEPELARRSIDHPRHRARARYAPIRDATRCCRARPRRTDESCRSAPPAGPVASYTRQEALTRPSASWRRGTVPPTTHILRRRAVSARKFWMRPAPSGSAMARLSPLLRPMKAKFSGNAASTASARRRRRGSVRRPRDWHRCRARKSSGSPQLAWRSIYHFDPSIISKRGPRRGHSPSVPCHCTRRVSGSGVQPRRADRTAQRVPGARQRAHAPASARRWPPGRPVHSPR